MNDRHLMLKISLLTLLIWVGASTASMAMRLDNYLAYALVFIPTYSLLLYVVHHFFIYRKQKDIAYDALIYIEDNVVTEGEEGWRDACLRRIHLAYDALRDMNRYE